jgi:hypothetical protein
MTVYLLFAINIGCNAYRLQQLFISSNNYCPAVLHTYCNTGLLHQIPEAISTYYTGYLTPQIFAAIIICFIIYGLHYILLALFNTGIVHFLQ